MDAISRDELYNAILQSINLFAVERRSGDLASFATDMELIGITSFDPAYKHDFDSLVDRQFPDASSGFSLAAEFLHSTIGDREMDGRDEYIKVLERAATDRGYRPDFLAPFRKAAG